MRDPAGPGAPTQRSPRAGPGAPCPVFWGIHGTPRATHMPHKSPPASRGAMASPTERTPPCAQRTPAERAAGPSLAQLLASDALRRPGGWQLWLGCRQHFCINAGFGSGQAGAAMLSRQHCGLCATSSFHQRDCKRRRPYGC